MGFTIAVHHRGSFVDEPKLHYKGGDVDAIHGLDIDTWSYFEALSLVKDLGYLNFASCKLWWKPPGSGFECLKPIT